MVKEVEPTTKIGKLIRARRLELGLTLDQFASKMRLSPSRASYLELRDCQTLQYGTVPLLARVLGLDPSVFTEFLTSSRKPTNSELGQLVRARREELGMSTITLAKKLKVKPPMVNQIEFGTAPLTENTGLLEKLARVLGLELSQLEAVRKTRKMKHMDRTPLAEFLLQKRLELRLTQREAGERADISVSAVTNMEVGKERAGTRVLNHYAEALGFTIPTELLIPPAEKISRPKKVDGPKRPPNRVHRAESTGLGLFLTARRMELGLTQGEVSKKAGMNQSALSVIERGTCVNPSPYLERLARALECEIPSSLIKLNYFGPDSEDLLEIKALSDTSDDREIKRRALQLFRLVLERQRDGYVVSFDRGEEHELLELPL